jgi:hypothetical protein
VIAVWLCGVVGDTAKGAEIDTLALDRFYFVGANVTGDYCHCDYTCDEKCDALFHGARRRSNDFEVDFELLFAS